MIYKCPNCNGALEYDPITDLMQCAHCGTGFAISEIENIGQKDSVDYHAETIQVQNSNFVNELGDNETEPNSADGNEEAKDLETEVFRTLGTMERRIYTCTACGAELSVNDNEVATFCAYCGQPTIVFSRVSKELKPETIVPFKISKEQAVEILKERLNKSHFLPKELKELKPENIKGIYIPYWIFDVYYYDIQYWEVDPHRTKKSDDKPLVYSREAECNLKTLTVDASDNLDDETSQRLEPFNLRDRKPFESAYLSGYYADKYDLGDQELYDFAIARAKELFDAEVRKTIPERNVEIISSLPKGRVNKAEYTMLPAWFMTFRYQGEPYTMVINGQTGKVVGTLPFDKKKITSLFGAVAGVTALIALILGIFMTLSELSIYIMMALTVFVPLIEVTIAFPIFAKIKKTGELTRAHRMEHFAKERQDRD